MRKKYSIYKKHIMNIKHNKSIELIKITCGDTIYHIGGTEIPKLTDDTSTITCEICGGNIYLSNKDYNNLKFQELQNRDNRYRWGRISNMTDQEYDAASKIVSVYECGGRV